jgi:1-acyl-sn-glycerol-3-phosphate acyltransferase
MLAWLAKIYLKLWGFELVGFRPSEKKFVILAGPHTSNWDVPLMLSAAAIYGIRVRWIGKHTLFYWPYGWFMRLIGGVPVDRRSSHNYVEQMADVIGKSETFALLITPEGTRSRSEYWKSGFYHIARAANVPIALAYMDFKIRKLGIVEVVYPTGDIDADFEIIHRLYHNKNGLYPECFGPVRLRPKDEPAVKK